MVVTTKRMMVARASQVWTRLLQKDLFSKVDTFCLFIGHGRSGGTLVGSLLNAHPNICVVNELGALHYLRAGLNAEQLYNLIYQIDKRFVKKGCVGGGGYSYAVPGQWQGRHQLIRVLGDRKAGATATEIMQHPEVLDILDREIKHRIRFINVIRNPYDSIMTSFRRMPLLPGESPENHFQREIKEYFQKCQIIAKVLERYGEQSVMQVHHEDMVGRTEENLAALCEFLGVEAKKNYLESCAGIVDHKPRITRVADEWTDDLVEVVKEKMQPFPWLVNYDFSN